MKKRRGVGFWKENRIKGRGWGGIGKKGNELKRGKELEVRQKEVEEENRIEINIRIIETVKIRLSKYKELSKKDITGWVFKNLE